MDTDFVFSWARNRAELDVLSGWDPLSIDFCRLAAWVNACARKEINKYKKKKKNKTENNKIAKQNK